MGKVFACYISDRGLNLEHTEKKQTRTIAQSVNGVMNDTEFSKIYKWPTF